MRILVTGANGQVGWELKQQGGESTHDVVALAREQMDISDEELANQKIAQYQPDIVINAAAYTAVDKAEQEPEIAFSINRDGALNLARACANASIPLLHISTDYVFDGSKDSPYEETDATSPLGIYGQSKWAGELAVRDSLQQHIILRTSWVFGVHGNNFVKTILRVAAERDELKVVHDQVGSPTSARGIADALLQICDRYEQKSDLPWGTYHFSGYPFTSWHGFAEQIVKLGREHRLLDHDVVIYPIPTSDYPTPAKRPANSRLANNLIQEKMSITPDDWQASLSTMIIALSRQMN